MQGEGEGEKGTLAKKESRVGRRTVHWARRRSDAKIASTCVDASDSPRDLACYKAIPVNPGASYLCQGRFTFMPNAHGSDQLEN